MGEFYDNLKAEHKRKDENWIFSKEKSFFVGGPKDGDETQKDKPTKETDCEGKVVYELEDGNYIYKGTYIKVGDSWKEVIQK